MEIQMCFSSRGTVARDWIKSLSFKSLSWSPEWVKQGGVPGWWMLWKLSAGKHILLKKIKQYKGVFYSFLNHLIKFIPRKIRGGRRKIPPSLSLSLALLKGDHPLTGMKGSGLAIDQLWGICITNPDGPYPKTWMKGYPSANPVWPWGPSSFGAGSPLATF